MDLFNPLPWNSDHKSQLDTNGHLLLPGLLTEQAQVRMTEALRGLSETIERARLAGHADPRWYGRFAGENNPWLEELIAHPQMLALARNVLGEEIRYDHCATLNRAAGDPGMHWHAHPYAETRPELGFLRMFFYVNGFERHDGGLKVVPGSHLFRDGDVRANTDADLQQQWLGDKLHPQTQAPLSIEHLQAPAGSVILMWTHALHAVSPRKATSDSRWLAVYAYRNPGEPSISRWINEEFEQRLGPQMRQLFDLY